MTDSAPVYSFIDTFNFTRDGGATPTILTNEDIVQLAHDSGQFSQLCSGCEKQALVIFYSILFANTVIRCHFM